MEEKDMPVEKRLRTAESETMKKRSRETIEMEEENDEKPQEAGTKRGRDPEQEEALEDEEVVARGASRDARLVTAIGQIP
eukprot:15514511-Heterocapsa_arctica.AAC.1